MSDDKSEIPLDDDFPTDEEMDAWLAEWDEVEAEAAQILAEKCADVLASPPPQPALEQAAAALRTGVAEDSWPWGYFRHGCDWSDGMPDDDATAWVSAVAASISPPEDPQTDIESQAAVQALLPADWLGLVVGLANRGAGAELTGEAWQKHIDDLPEIADDSDDPEGELAAFQLAIEVLDPLWEALGILDENRRLTDLGRWGLPRGLLLTWPGDDTDADEVED